MNETSKWPLSSWLDFSLMAVGFWMLFSPAFLKFQTDKPENWLAALLGLLVIILAFGQRRGFRNWEAWLSILLGAVLIGLPWVVGFHAGSAKSNAVICGVITVIVAVSRWYAHDRGLDTASKAPTAA